MKTRAVILAGGQGTRLEVLTHKRTKPAVPFAGKYRIIDFALSNCVNSNLFDIMIIAQYRPHSLMEHIGSGGPWDLDRNFTGGIRIYTPYQALVADWFVGTANAVQQNFRFIKQNNPDQILILSGDHIYKMDYSAMINFHLEKEADLTLATIEVPYEDANRFGIVGIDQDQRVTSFIEKPSEPPSNLANMGVYLFRTEVLDKILWSDSLRQDSSHDFGKDIIPALIHLSARVFAYPFHDYWVDVGTVNSYWKAHMDLLEKPPAFDLYNRTWIVHTRSEEQPPVKIEYSAVVEDSLICDGCIIESGAHVIRSVLSPGVIVQAGAVVKESIVLTDTVIESGASIQRTVLDKKVRVGAGAQIGAILPKEIRIAMVGKSSIVPAQTIIEPGGIIGTDVIPSDYSELFVRPGERVQTRRLPNEL